jgi:hypothetical protein
MTTHQVLDTSTLELVKEVKQVNMGIFISAVAFSADETAVIAVAGDATAYVLDLPLPSAGSRGGSAAATGWVVGSAGASASVGVSGGLV